MRKIKNLFSLITLFFLFSNFVFADNYYVSSKRGNNLTGDGTVTRPWKTITYALAKVRGHGHVINIESGNYSSKMDPVIINNEIFPIFLKEGISILGANVDSVHIIGDVDKSVFSAIEFQDTTTFIKNVKVDSGDTGFSFQAASYKIQNCVICNQNGCGISSSVPYNKTAYLIIEENLFFNNNGAISLVNTNGVVKNDTIQFNKEYGILIADDAYPADIKVINNTIIYNEIGASGAIHCGNRGAPLIANNLIQGNILKSGVVTGAGAIYCGFKTEARIINNYILENERAIYIDGESLPTFCNNVIANGFGRAIFIDSFGGDAYPLILNNTIVNNTGTAIFINSKTNSIINNIIANNNGYGIEENSWQTNFDPDSVLYNCFYNNNLGIYLDEGTRVIPDAETLNLLVPECRANIGSDPNFSDTLYHLQEDSPCIDQGHPVHEYNDPEDPNNSGFALCPALGNLRNDIGAYGGPGSIGWLPDSIPPAPVNDLAALSTTDISVTLRWTVPGDDGNFGGRAFCYNVRYSNIEIDNNIKEWWDNAYSARNIPSPLSPGEIQTFTVCPLDSGITYYFAIKTADEMGNWSDLSNIDSATTPVEFTIFEFPKSYHLDQNYPNPFNPETNIKYQLPKHSDVALKIYNITGQIVKTLIEEKQLAGYYSVIWNGRDEMGNDVASGVYFYQLSAKYISAYSKQNFVQKRKMILVR